MSQYKKTDEIFIVTKKLGYIPQLRTSGPIPNPIKVPAELCLEMIIAGVQLFQYQVGTGKLVELTIDNLYDADKFDDKVEESQPEQKEISDDIITELPAPGVKLAADDEKTALEVDGEAGKAADDGAEVLTDGATDADGKAADDEKTVLEEDGEAGKAADDGAEVLTDGAAVVDEKAAAPVANTRNNTRNNNRNR